MLLEKEAGKNDGDGGIERGEHDGRVETAELRGADEDDAAGDFENSGADGDSDGRRGQGANLAEGEHDGERHHKRCKPGADRNPERGALTGVMNAEEETGEAASGQDGEAETAGTAAAQVIFFEGSIRRAGFRA